MLLGATSLAAVPIADGGEDDLHGGALTLIFTLAVSFTRGSNAPVYTPSSAGGFNVEPGGTWQITADPPNINVSP